MKDNPFDQQALLFPGVTAGTIVITVLVAITTFVLLTGFRYKGSGWQFTYSPRGPVGSIVWMQYEPDFKAWEFRVRTWQLVVFDDGTQREQTRWFRFSKEGNWPKKGGDQ